MPQFRKHPRTFTRLAAGLLAAMLLVGCSDDPSEDSDQAADASSAPALTQQRSDATLTSFDGTPIALTLFQPALAEGQTAPVLIYSHGWGANRSKDLAGDNVLTTVARRAWESGYFVITFDARGFGESGGEINLQDPAIEGRDVSAVIDWAHANLGARVAAVDGDPQIGGIGLSYAGGFQLAGAAVDARFDALVPAVTWHDLSYSLAPSGVPKTLWLTYLYAGGMTRGNVAPWLDTLYEESRSGSVSAESSARLAGNGLSSYCSGQRTDGMGSPTVDAFFIQGVNDTLFNANEAVRNFECLRNAGNDAYLLVARGGHLIPELQNGTPGEFDREAQCGATRYNLGELAWTFLDGKLRARQASIDMPRACFVLSDSAGLVTEQVPRGGSAFTAQATVDVGPPSTESILGLLSRTDIETIQAYLNRLPADVRDRVQNALLNQEDPAGLNEDVPALLQEMPLELADQIEPTAQFVPLHTASAAQTLVGIPLASMQVQGDASLDPRFFVGLGILRVGATEPDLLHDQVLPIRGTGQISTELVGVSTPLAAGDQVGVMLYGFHPQYADSYTKTASQLTINGSVELPIQ